MPRRLSNQYFTRGHWGSCMLLVHAEGDAFARPSHGIDSFKMLHAKGQTLDGEQESQIWKDVRRYDFHFGGGAPLLIYNSSTLKSNIQLY